MHSPLPLHDTATLRRLEARGIQAQVVGQRPDPHAVELVQPDLFQVLRHSLTLQHNDVPRRIRLTEIA